MLVRPSMLRNTATHSLTPAPDVCRVVVLAPLAWLQILLLLDVLLGQGIWAVRLQQQPS